MYIDVHSHLDHPALFEKLDEIIENSKKAGVKKIITCGVDSESNKKSIEIAKKYDIVEFALGIYPPDALRKEQENVEQKKFQETDVDKEIEFIEKQKPFAISEIGLDLQNGKNIEMQTQIFKKMIILAQKLDIPVVVHSRKAEKQAIEVLKEMKAKKVVMHCFSGKLKDAKLIAEQGWYLSIPPNIINSEHFQNIVREVDISRLLTETDAPYLGPAKIFPNEPKYVVKTIEKIAEIKKMDKLEVQKNIFMNFQKLFY